MMRRNRIRHSMRRGFTLVEVLVILAIISALAAILVPTVSNQVRKADIGRVTGDLTNLRGGVEAFLVNVHRYPGTLRQLSVPITGADADIAGSTYPTGLVSRWDGPYIDRVMPAAGALITGFGGEIQDALTTITDASGVEYLVVLIAGIAQPEFERLDVEMDETIDAAAGRLRWVSGGADTVKFLALPIN